MYKEREWEIYFRDLSRRNERNLLNSYDKIAFFFSFPLLPSSNTINEKAKKNVRIVKVRLLRTDDESLTVQNWIRSNDRVGKAVEEKRVEGTRGWKKRKASYTYKVKKYRDSSATENWISRAKNERSKSVVEEK